jgi:hypothetical protein
MPCGASGSFRPLEEIAEELRTVPEFGDLATAFEATPASLRVLYESCMQQSQMDALLNPLIERLSEANRQHPFMREHLEYYGDEDLHTVSGATRVEGLCIQGNHIMIPLNLHRGAA